MNYAPKMNRRSFIASAAAVGGGFALGFEIPYGPSVVRAQYLDALNGALDRYKRELGGAGIDYCTIDTSTPLEFALMSYLSTRGRAH